MAAHVAPLPPSPAAPLAGRRLRVGFVSADLRRHSVAFFLEPLLEHADRARDLFERRDFEKPASAGEGEVVGTNFERKFRREGRPFHAMTLVRA